MSKFKIWHWIVLILGVSLFLGILNKSVNASNDLSVKEATPIDIWLDGLAWYESQNHADIKHLDSNNRYSYGCLQFQMETFSSYIKRYGLLPNAEEGEYANWIYDCDFQRDLAKRMLAEDRNNWQHWYTSVEIRGLGLPPEISS